MEQCVNAFGFLASGRLVSTDFKQVDPTHYIMLIYDIEALGHIAVFLTGNIQFPEGLAGLVYFSEPIAGVEDQWHLLGSISNEKPSAIFRISNLKRDCKNSESNLCNYFGLLGGKTAPNCVAKIGISVEPIIIVEQFTRELANASFNNPVLASDFAENMLVSLYNYVASFAKTIPAINETASTDQDANELFVPLKFIETWYANFKRKLALNPNFWKTAQ